MGPSVRLAELIAQQWGNNRYYSRVTAVDKREGYIEAEGIYQDLETNSVVGAKVRRRITNSKGRTYNDDMILVTGNAAASIALRNAILKGVPRPIWRRAYVAAAEAVRGDIKTLGGRRVALLEAFKELGIKPPQVFGMGKVKGEADIGLDELVVLAGIFTAIKNGEATVDDILGRQMAPQADKTLGQAFRESTSEPAAEGAPAFAPHTLPAAGKKAAPATPPHDDRTGEIFDSPEPDSPEAEAEAEEVAEDSDEGETSPSQASSDASPAQPDQLSPSAGIDAADEAEAEDDPDAPYIDAFGDFTADLRTAENWLVAKAKLSAFRKTEPFQKASAALRREAMVNTYRIVAAIPGEQVRPDSDPSFFSLWIMLPPAPHEIKPTFGKLIGTKLYDALTEPQKDAMSASVSAALGEED